MSDLERSEVIVPANVDPENMDLYIDNYLNATKGTGRLLLFAGDQKIEHLNSDFYGPGIPEDDADPEHLFKIAAKSNIGVFAAHHGLIARYAPSYKDIPYLVKMNGKTKLQKGEPLSQQLVDLDDVLDLIDNGYNVVGVGYTIYIGSEHEHLMLSEAAQLIADAHREGLIVVLWMYPRGENVKDKLDADLIAGCAGVACCLGADFAKVNQAQASGEEIASLMKQSAIAAGRTGVIVSGGAATDPGAFLHLTWQHVNEAKCAGAAVGRNIHQRPLDEAIRLANALGAIIYDCKSTHEAWLIYTAEPK